MKQINVVAAIIFNKNKLLCVKRGESKYSYVSNKYEFPGGKIEANETQVAALKREVQEELSLNIEVGDKFITVNHNYPDFSVRLHTYLCNSENRVITLHEHIDYKWLSTADLEKLDWAAADIPIIDKLMAIKSN
ncbi:MAG: (deoxy)nucleoside triphosphate pyrophosphohydrolase [Magnetococcales bacterium]|nr:(deoxy)nucleoside triphosphate pyrophosphohydrolase [Magnetococcales bacterium]